MTEQGKKAYLYPQEDVNYTPMSEKRGQMCGGCRWFNDGGESLVGDPNRYVHCQLVQSYPLPIRATGWCEEFTAIPEPEDPQRELIDMLEDFIENKETDENSTRVENVSVLDKVKELFSKLRGIKARDEPTFNAGFKSLGNGKWIAMWSNNFEDLEGEYFSAKATDEYIERLDTKEIPMPELWFWHIPYAFGQAKAVARIAADERPNAPSFNIAVGDFYDTPQAKALEKATLKSNRNYKMSHGFFYPSDTRIDGVYHYYDTFEISVLPDYAAANPFTLFGDEQMPISPNKIKELETALGGDKTLLADVVALVERKGKEIADTGQGYKEKSIPAVDTEAREQLTELGKSITELTEQVKAAMKPPVDDEDEAAKKKKADEAKKETDTAISALTKQVSDLTNEVKSFLDLTPRRASKANETIVPSEDPALKELAQGAVGEKSNDEKVYNAAFGWMSGVGGNK